MKLNENDKKELDIIITTFIEVAIAGIIISGLLLLTLLIFKIEIQNSNGKIIRPREQEMGIKNR